MSDNQVEEIAVEIPLTEEKFQEYRKRIVDLITKEIPDLKKAKKDATAVYNEQIKWADAELMRLGKIIKSGAEVQNIECTWIHNEVTKKMELIRMDTRDVIKTRELRQDDLQLSLFDKCENPIDCETEDEEDDEEEENK